MTSREANLELRKINPNVTLHSSGCSYEGKVDNMSENHLQTSLKMVFTQPVIQNP